MNAQDIQRMIDQTEYWDVNILDFKTAFFGDEAFLYIYNDATSCWKVCFSFCYEVKYRTDADRRKIPFVKNIIAIPKSAIISMFLIKFFLFIFILLLKINNIYILFRNGFSIHKTNRFVKFLLLFRLK